MGSWERYRVWLKDESFNYYLKMYLNIEKYKKQIKDDRLEKNSCAA